MASRERGDPEGQGQPHPSPAAPTPPPNGEAQVQVVAEIITEPSAEGVASPIPAPGHEPSPDLLPDEGQPCQLVPECVPPEESAQAEGRQEHVEESPVIRGSDWAPTLAASSAPANPALVASNEGPTVADRDSRWDPSPAQGQPQVVVDNRLPTVEDEEHTGVVADESERPGRGLIQDHVVVSTPGHETQTEIMDETTGQVCVVVSMSEGHPVMVSGPQGPTAVMVRASDGGPVMVDGQETSIVSTEQGFALIRVENIHQHQLHQQVSLQDMVHSLNGTSSKTQAIITDVQGISHLAGNFGGNALAEALSQVIIPSLAIDMVPNPEKDAQEEEDDGDEEDDDDEELDGYEEGHDEGFEDNPVHKMKRPPTLKGKRPYKCEVDGCSTRFQDKSHLYRHIQSVHRRRVVFVDEEGNEEIEYQGNGGETNPRNRFLHRPKPQSELKGQRRFPCEFPGCKWVFTRSNHVLRHQQRVHPGFKPVVEDTDDLKPYICDCDDCGLKFKTISILTRHKRTVHQATLYQTEDGEEVEGMHLRSSPKKILYRPPPEELVRPYACDVEGCDYRFTRKDHLVRHKERIHKPGGAVPVEGGEGEGEGEGEGVEGEEGDTPRPPMIVVKPRRPFVCDLSGCGKSYIKHSHLIRHRVHLHRIQRPRKPKPDPAVIPEAITSAEGINLPPPRDPEERPYICSFPGCAWSFKRSYHLDRHVEAHQRKSNGEADVNLDTEGGTETEGLPPEGYLLDDCQDPKKKHDWGLRLRKKKEESAVKLVETIALAIEKEKFPEMEEERPVCCEFPGCGRRFKKKNHLDAHYIVHASPSDKVRKTAPKKRSLEEGQQEAGLEDDPEEGLEDNPEDFFEKPKFRRKKKKKSGKGTYTCDVEGCEKKFSRNCELTRHKLNHTDIWPFTCEFVGCGRKFKRKDIYRNHQKTHNKTSEQGTEGQPKAKAKPRKKPKPLLPPEQILQATHNNSDLWATPVGSWVEQGTHGVPVSISVIPFGNTSNHLQVCSNNTTMTTATVAGAPGFPPNIHQQQQQGSPSGSWGQQAPQQQQQGRPSVVQSWGAVPGTGTTITGGQGWTAMVSRPSVVQGTWSGAIRQPVDNHTGVTVTVTQPNVLETLGLRPAAVVAPPPQLWPPSGPQAGPPLAQCRYATTSGSVVPPSEHRESSWTL